MSGGQARLPITFRTLYGAAGGAAAQHSETVYPQLLPVPGLKIVVPSGPVDMKGLLKSAIRDDNPVVLFEHAALGRSREEVPDGEYLVPIGKAAIKREGKRRDRGGDRRDGAASAMAVASGWPTKELMSR